MKGICLVAFLSLLADSRSFKAAVSNNISSTPAVATTAANVANKSTYNVSIKDFGGVCDGSHDDTLAVQTAIDAVNQGGSGIGGSVYFPAGRCKITGVNIFGASGVHLFGAGQTTSSSQIIYSGAANGAAITIQNSQNTLIQHLDISGNGITGAIGVSIQWDGISNFNSVHNKLDGVNIHAVDIGVKIGDGTTHSVSEGEFHDLHINGCTTAGVQIDSSNAQNQIFYNPRITSCATGINSIKGDVRIYGGLFALNSVVDIYLETPLTGSLISGVYTEQSNGFIKTGGPSSTQLPLLLEGNIVLSKDSVTGYGVTYNLGGALTLIGNYIGIRNFPVQIAAGGLGGSFSTIVSRGNTFWVANPFVAGFQGNAILDEQNDIYYDGKVSHSLSVPTFASDQTGELYLLRPINSSLDKKFAINWATGTSNKLTTLWALGNDLIGDLGTFGLYDGTNNIYAWKVLSNDQFQVSQLLTKGLPPSLTNCGSGSPLVAAGSNSNGGQFTMGTSTPAACTVKFAREYPNNAYCTVTAANTAAAGTSFYVSSSSKAAFTITLASGANGAAYNYSCNGN